MYSGVQHAHEARTSAEEHVYHNDLAEQVSQGVLLKASC